MGQYISGFSPKTMFTPSPTKVSSPPRKKRKVHFELAYQQRCASRRNVIIPESPDPSFKTDSPYCSQSLREVLKPYDSEKAKITIPSITEYNCDSQIEISEVVTTVQTNTSRTISGLDQMDICNPLQGNMRISECSQSNLSDMQMKSPDTSCGTTQNKDDMTPSLCKNSEVLSSPQLFSDASSKDARDFDEQEDSKENYVIPDTPVANVGRRSARKKVQFGSIAEPCTTFDPTKANEYEYMRMDDQNYYDPSAGDCEEPIRSTASYLCMLQDKSQKSQIHAISKNQSQVTCSNPVRRTADYLCTQNLLQHLYSNEDCSAQSLDVIPSKTAQNSLSFVPTNVFPDSKLVLTSLQEADMPPPDFQEKTSSENNDEEINALNCSRGSDDMNFCTSLTLSSHDSSPRALPPNVLLSNYCSEYDRSYISKDLKPNLLGNYCSYKTKNPLVKEFEAIIPKNQSLQEFFDASDESFEEVAFKVQSEVQSFLDIEESEVSITAETLKEEGS
ncbi:hypothetical protein QAD02_009952 [Eretmocerus hayati]|uniref:Uncharacterized protein n=1 Tax=Eretmocerus hayati TaxID=131215 RepID=A0ACC2NAR3_9HYME|nr:hypothetical protein QAD02_009952 [Eretmocerus hayati]